MKEIVRTNDTILVTAIEALLNGANIPHMIADNNMSVLEGSIGILPRRVLVQSEDWSRARRVLQEAGLGDWVNADEAS